MWGATMELTEIDVEGLIRERAIRTVFTNEQSEIIFLVKSIFTGNIGHAQMDRKIETMIEQESDKIKREITARKDSYEFDLFL